MSKQETLSAVAYRSWVLSNQRKLPSVLAPIPEPKRSKYNARKTERHGRIFDSLAEADRASALLLLERARVIRGLGFQPKFALLGGKGRPVAHYVADFCYMENGKRVVEDVKSTATLTPASRLKLKLFLQQNPDTELRLVDRDGKAVPFRYRTPREAA
jgi:hypothetical protein